MGKAFKTIFGTVFISLSVAGCSDFSARPFANNNSFAEGGQSGEPLENFTAEEIYARGEYELADNDADQAAVYFGEIERLYPYSEWAKRALIMQAFAYHQDQDYENSRAAAQRYIDFYPADEDAAYAQYLLALSY